MVDCVEIPFLFNKNNAQVEPGIEDLRVDLYRRSELFTGFIKALELQILHSKIISRHKVFGIEVDGSFIMNDCLSGIAFASKVGCSLKFLLRKGWDSLIELTGRDHTTGGLLVAGGLFPQIDH